MADISTLSLDERIVQWVICTAAEYHAMDTHPENKLYFLYDTEEFYRGDIPFATSIIFYDGERPLTGANRKIYVDSKTLNGYVYDGYWQQVITQYNVVGEVLDDTPGDSIPNVDALRRFIETSISDMKYNPESHAIEYTQGNLIKAVIIDGLMVDSKFDDKTNCLNFYDVNGDIISQVKLPKDKALTKAIYDNETKNVILTVTDVDGGGEPVELIFPLQDLIAIPISNVEGNLLKEHPDGYAVVIDLSKKMDKINIDSDEDVGGVVISTNDGNARATRYQIGGPHLSLEELPEGGEQPKDNLLATEQAVYNFITDLKRAVDAVSTLIKVDTINRDAPNTNNYPSEIAVAAMWKELETATNTFTESVSAQLIGISSDVLVNKENIERLQKDAEANAGSSEEYKLIIGEQIAEINEKININTSGINNNSGSISNLQNSFTALNQSVAELISGLEELGATHNLDIETLRASITNLSDQIVGISNQQTSTENNFNSTLQNAISSVNQDISNLTAKIENLETDVEEIKRSQIKVYNGN